MKEELSDLPDEEIIALARESRRFLRRFSGIAAGRRLDRDPEGEAQRRWLED